MNTVFLRYPEGKAKAVTFSYDDGAEADIRLASVFDKYGMKCTFNFNCNRLRGFKFSNEQLREIFLSRGHEIAVHGAEHRANGNTRPIEGIRDVLDCRLELEERCGRIIRGMAYPNSGITRMSNFTTYEKIKSYLTELDIAYARTLGGDNDRFELPTDWHAWMPSAHHNNPNVFEYVDKFLEISFDPPVYCDRRYPCLLYIWGHSYEFDRNDNWDRIEKICEKLAGHDDIWFATNIEICDYVESYKRLVFSADGHTVYNPTVTNIWIDVDSVLHEIPSGATVTI